MKFSIASSLLCILLSCNLYAATTEITQKDKAFSLAEVKIKKGDTIRFTNKDPFFHNVFSLSDAKLFDLGSYAQGEFKDVVFDQAGVVDVECAIHTNMKLKVTVE